MARAALVDNSKNTKPIEALITNDVSKRMEKSFDEIGKVLPERITKVFSGQGSRDGFNFNWKPASEIAQINRKNPSRRNNEDALIDTGAYQKSIKVLNIDSNKDGISLRIGSDLKEKAKGHEFGALHIFEPETIERVIPIRSVHFITNADIEIIDEIIEGSFNDN